MPNCYYYDEQRNHCNCYVNVNLNELLEENAQLRERLMWINSGDITHVLTDQEYIDLQKERRHMRDAVTAYDLENAKLKELVLYMWASADADYFSTLPEHMNHRRDVYQRMRQLGIEVRA